MAIADNIDREAAEWIDQLYDEGTSELDDIVKFLQLQRTQLKDTAQGQEAEAEIKDLKQRGRPTKEPVW